MQKRPLLESGSTHIHDSPQAGQTPKCQVLCWPRGRRLLWGPSGVQRGREVTLTPLVWGPSGVQRGREADVTLSVWFLLLRVVTRRQEFWGRPCPAAAGPVGILTARAPMSALRPAGHALGMYTCGSAPPRDKGAVSASWWGQQL